MRRGLAVLVLAAVPATVALAAPLAPAADGHALFAACVACHGAGGEGSELGPDIRGVVGQKAAAQPDFAYSAALRRSGKQWSAAELAAFLLDPQAAVPGTRMGYAGAGSAENARALAAFVATLR